MPRLASCAAGAELETRVVGARREPAAERPPQAFEQGLPGGGRRNARRPRSQLLAIRDGARAAGWQRLRVKTAKYLPRGAQSRTQCRYVFAERGQTGLTANELGQPCSRKPGNNPAIIILNLAVQFARNIRLPLQKLQQDHVMAISTKLSCLHARHLCRRMQIVQTTCESIASLSTNA